LIRDLQARERNESLRVLYVGMTRAKKGLYMSWTGSVEKNSWGEFLLEYVRSTDLSTLVTFQTIKDQETVSYPASVEPVSVRGPFCQQRKHVSSENIEFNASVQDLAWPQLSLLNKKKQQGVILHRLFESLRYHDVPQVLKLGEKWLPEQQTELAKALEFLCSLQEPHMQTLLKEGHVEWGFQKTLLDEAVTEGRVDLWGFVEQTLWVVDYKTGSSRFREKAFTQMRVYAGILREYTGWHGDIKMCALFPFTQEIFIKSYKA